MKLSISRSAFLAAASVCMAQQDVRYYLNGIHIERAPADEGVLIVSTDGHRLFAAHDENAEFSDDWPSDVTIKFGKESIRAFKLVKNLDTPVTLGMISRSLTVSVEVGDSIFSDAEEIEGKFPEWRRTVVEREGQTSGGWFNPVYLSDFEKACRFLGKRSKFQAMTIKQDDPNKSAVVQFNNIDYAFGVIMPIREDGRALPKWAVGPFKAPEK